MITSFILLIYFIIFAFISWRNLRRAIIIFAALLPAYLIRFNIGPFPSTLLEGMILVLVVVWLAKSGLPRVISRFKKEIPYQPYPFQGPIILLMTAATISIFISANSWQAMGLWRAYFLEPILFFLVFVNVISKKEELNKIFLALSFSALAVSLIAIWQRFSPAGINFGGNFLWPIPNEFWREASSRRVTSFLGYPNAVGLFLGPLVVLFLGWLVAEKNKLAKKLFKVLVIFLSILAIFWAKSEATLIGLGICFILFGLFLSKKSRFLTTGLLVLLIIIILLTPIQTWLMEKLLLKDFSGQIRIQIWQETLAMLKDHWLWGAGLAGYQKAITPYHQTGIEIFGKFQPIEIYLYPHNIIFNFWSEIGLLGLIAFIWLLVEYFFRAIKIYLQKIDNFSSTMTLSIMFSAVLILIQGLVDVPYFKNDLAVLFWLILGFLVVLARNPQLDYK